MCGVTSYKIHAYARNCALASFITPSLQQHHQFIKSGGPYCIRCCYLSVTQHESRVLAIPQILYNRALGLVSPAAELTVLMLTDRVPPANMR